VPSAPQRPIWAISLTQATGSESGSKPCGPGWAWSCRAKTRQLKLMPLFWRQQGSACTWWRPRLSIINRHPVGRPTSCSPHLLQGLPGHLGIQPLAIPAAAGCRRTAMR